MRIRGGREAAAVEVAEPLIGVEQYAAPDWAQLSTEAVGAGFRQAVRALPAAVSVLLRLAWRASPGLTMLAGTIHLVSGSVTTFGLLATADVFTSLLSDVPTPTRVMDALPAVAVVVAAYAGRALLQAAAATVDGALRPRVVTSADAEVTAALTHCRLLAFEDADFRELARRATEDGVLAVEVGFRQLPELVSAVVAVVAAAVAAGLLNPWLAPALLLAALADGWASGRVANLRYRYQLDTLVRTMRKEVVRDVAVDRGFALERHALGLQDRLLAEYRRIAESIMRDEIRLERRSSVVELIGRAGSGIGSGVAYLVLGLLLFTGSLALAKAGSAVLALRTAGNALTSLTENVNYLYENSFNLEFYTKLLEQAAEHRLPTSGLTAPADPAEIRLENVSFTYPGQDTPALSEISLTIRRGEVVALVGENGSGKTTLGKLITGLYPPSKGAIYWDDIDLSVAEPRSVHSRIAVIAQEPARWPMTAYHNVVVGRLDRPDREAAWQEAITASGADQVIDTLSLREKTVLSKRFNAGTDLSGGQWQRIGVARGIYRDAAVLIADEPTAALDAKAEATVFAGLRHAGSGRTTVLVTHRLANIKDVDRIVVLDHGRIIEAGTHAELMRHRGRYHELFDLQAAAYRDAEE
ncbi:ABC transporter ATP-binding protein [Nocardia transvalensis]|uniref:ABC transporter ATP-binding protein n=1 Tax=Nocardia transvalensis TaxID=37333 RepID=UPI0018958A23|nr:ABC transporter ATP-binding protein [Nocardia transvalensis]MBF6329592.1 ABC transporter ATP-binding protein [Nocardia transvalensis]